MSLERAILNPSMLIILFLLKSTDKDDNEISLARVVFNFKHYVNFVLFLEILNISIKILLFILR